MSSYIWYTQNTDTPKFYMEVDDESKYNKFLRPQNLKAGTTLLVCAKANLIYFACVVKKTFDISNDMHHDILGLYVTTVFNDSDE